MKKSKQGTLELKTNKLIKKCLKRETKRKMHFEEYSARKRVISFLVIWQPGIIFSFFEESGCVFLSTIQPPTN